MHTASGYHYKVEVEFFNFAENKYIYIYIWQKSELQESYSKGHVIFGNYRNLM